MIENASLISSEPDIHCGVSTGRLFAREDVAHDLLEDEAHAERGEQRFERAPVQPAHDAALDERCRPGRTRRRRQGSATMIDAPM